MFRSDQCMYARRGYACHNHWLLCTGVIALHANNDTMSVDTLHILYYFLQYLKHPDHVKKFERCFALIHNITPNSEYLNLFEIQQNLI